MRGPEKTFPELPSWTFFIDEISVGVYRVRGSNADGMIIEHSHKAPLKRGTAARTGDDPEALLANCKLSAENADFEEK